jgi:hypothetical protein
MKYIVIFLALANVIYFGWLNLGATSIVPPRFSEPGPLLSDGMILLSEYESRISEEELILEEQSRTCLMITGFLNFDDAISFENAASNRGLSASNELKGNLQASQFRVYLPPASSAAVAAITLAALNERVAEMELAVETYLITQGLLENSIALGVVSTLARAEEIQSDVINLGYNPDIQELPQSDEGVAIRLSAPNSLSLESNEWLDLVVQRPYLDAIENLCETIAQGAQFP